MTNSNPSFYAPQIFTVENYQIWSVRMKPYFETYLFCDAGMEEKFLQQLLADSINVQKNALPKELLNQARLLRVFFKHKTKRRKKKEEILQVKKTIKRIEHQLLKQNLRRSNF